MRVTSNGENIANLMYLPPSPVNQPFSYPLVDSVLFSRLPYPIASYALSSAPAWLSLTDRTLSGTPAAYFSFPTDLLIELLATDSTHGTTLVRLLLTVTNESPVILRDFNLTKCA